MTKNMNCVIAENTNDIWGFFIMEGTEVCTEEKRRKTYLVIVYDVRSKYIFYIKYHYLISKHCRCSVLKQVLEEFGLPYYLVCEEKYRAGLEFLSHDYGIAFLTPEDLGVREQNGWRRLIRYFQVMQNRIPPQNSIHKNIVIAGESRKKWNDYRLGREDFPRLAYKKQWAMQAFLDKNAYWHSFLVKTERLVSSHGIVTILNQEYKVPDCYAEKRIIFRVDPQNPREIYIYDEERNWKLFVCPMLTEARNEKFQYA